MNVLMCPLSQPGYLYPAIAVGLELARRGDDVTIIGEPAACRAVTSAGLTALPAEELGAARSFHVGRWFLDGADQHGAVVRAARTINADVLVTSVLGLGGLVAAETLDLPVIVLGFAAHIWNYRQPGQVGTVRAWRHAEMLRHCREVRERVGMPSGRCIPDGMLTGSALLLRAEAAFEEPGSVLPDRVHHVGPCFWEPEADLEELDEITTQLDRVGKPVVYVHLGRTFGGSSLWPRLNAAFTDSKFQAIVEKGRSGSAEPAKGADLLVVRRPWMLPLIERADLVLTSGTSAPVLGALRSRRPLVVAPSGSEQQVLAAACVRLGVAVPLADDPQDCAATIAEAWGNDTLAARAREIGDRLARQPGPAGVADLMRWWCLM